MPQPTTSPDVEQRLDDHQDQITRLQAQRELDGDHAAQARSLAANLTATVQPLRSLFDGIRSLHTPTTWQGNAATQSRIRLDAHEARTYQAIRQLDALIDDLEDRALQLEQLRSTRLGEIEDLQWQVYLLEKRLTHNS